MSSGIVETCVPYSRNKFQPVTLMASVLGNMFFGHNLSSGVALPAFVGYATDGTKPLPVPVPLMVEPGPATSPNGLGVVLRPYPSNRVAFVLPRSAVLIVTGWQWQGVAYYSGFDDSSGPNWVTPAAELTPEVWGKASSLAPYGFVYAGGQGANQLQPLSGRVGVLPGTSSAVGVDIDQVVPALFGAPSMWHDVRWIVPGSMETEQGLYASITGGLSSDRWPYDPAVDPAPYTGGAAFPSHFTAQYILRGYVVYDRKILDSERGETVV